MIAPRSAASSSATSLLHCPDCRSALQAHGPSLECSGCASAWPVVGGLPRLFHEAHVRASDRLLRAIYDSLPFLHDPAVRLILPVAQLERTSERRLRERFFRRLELERLEVPRDGRPIRILEVGIGTGANIPFLERRIPRGVDVELWGLDLSVGMLRICQRRARTSRCRVELVHGDAHALPFADETFDRVFHVGATNSFGDPQKALSEFARVARRDTPIVVVDEQLDPSRAHALWHRAFFRAITFYDRHPHCPRELLPDAASQVVEEQISRFFYCLTFKMPSVRPKASNALA